MDKETIIKLIKENDNITTHDDEFEVLDLVIEKDKDTFIKDIVGLQCPLCRYVFVSHGNPLMKLVDDDNLKGIEMQCAGCGQLWYIHYPVVVPNKEQMDEVDNVEL